MGHPHRTVVVVLAVLSLAACPTRRDEGTSGSNAADASRLSLPDLLAAVHDRTPEGELRVLRQLPPPLEIRREPVRNRHDPTLVDTLVTFVHPGLRVEVYHVTASERDIVRSVGVTDEAYRTADGIGPGSSREQVLAAFGRPDSVARGPARPDPAAGRTDPDPAAGRSDRRDSVPDRPGHPDSVVGTTLVYHGIGGEPSPTPTVLSIELRDDRVRRMTWSYYVD